MTTDRHRGPPPSGGAGDDRWLERLRELGEELRATLADERSAISALDHARLSYLSAHKQYLAEQLAEAQRTAAVVEAPIVRELFAALRVEAHANALLASAATEAVRALLGYQSTGGYDRAARRTIPPPTRTILATY